MISEKKKKKSHFFWVNCKSAADCEAGESCLEFLGVCVCYNESGIIPRCGGEEKCLNGTGCVCGQNNQKCLPNFACKGGICLCNGKECKNGESCSGEMCKCGNNPGCGTDEKCENGKCTKLSPTESSMSSISKNYSWMNVLKIFFFTKVINQTLANLVLLKKKKNQRIIFVSYLKRLFFCFFKAKFWVYN